jgi:hypothetical protein
VARSLQWRLAALEASNCRCPECGSDGNPTNNIDYEVIWHDDPEEDDRPEETAYCEACGKPTTFIVTWQDLK